MPKTFYTERDIADLAARDVAVIDLGDDVVMTDLAVEKALSLGIRLARKSGSSGSGGASAPSSQDETVAKVKAAVIARLGNGVDATLLDAVVSRVVASLK